MRISQHFLSEDKLQICLSLLPKKRVRFQASNQTSHSEQLFFISFTFSGLIKHQKILINMFVLMILLIIDSLSNHYLSDQ